MFLTYLYPKIEAAGKNHPPPGHTETINKPGLIGLMRFTSLFSMRNSKRTLEFKQQVKHLCLIHFLNKAAAATLLK